MRFRTRLIVLIVVDQLGSLYMSRYGDQLDGGIALLRRRGAYYANGVHAVGNTETCPGHASIVTGTWPDEHGIVSNYWVDEKTQSKVGCIADRTFGASPHNLEVPGIADAVKLATAGQGKVVTVSIKDRAAVLTAGKSPTAAVWYDPAAGRFVSGQWYGADGPPGWLTPISVSRTASSALGETWTRLRPEVDYERVAGVDDEPSEEDVPGLARTFPRELGRGLAGSGMEEWSAAYTKTPQALDTLMEIAKEAVKAEGLGRRDVLDLLVLGVSSLDYAGHAWGPSSHEALDMLFRIDRAVLDFVETVEAALGSGSVLWVLTGDHGVAEIPEVAQRRGVRAERISQRPFLAAADAALLGLRAKERSSSSWRVSFFDPPRLYLSQQGPANPGLKARDQGELRDARRAVAAALAATNRLIDAKSIDDVGSFSEPYRTWFLRSTFSRRSPDVLLLTRPHDLVDWTLATDVIQGSNHGSPYNYDTRVPMVFAGPGVRRGEDPAPFDITRIAPTIAALVGIDPPAAARASPLPAVGF